MKLKPYPHYKPSGMEWLGDVPMHWTISPLFTVLDEIQDKNVGNRVQDVLSLSYGRIIERDVESNHGLLPESFETYQIVGPNDLVLRLTDLQNDQRSLRVGKVKQQGIITSAYTCLRPKERVNPNFAHLLLHGYDLRKVFYGLGGGVRQSMKFDDLKRLPYLLPPPSEQSAIAAFLDRETGKIDTLITKQEKLIELLQEKRQAVISHAVTKGLDPTAPMKPSGVEWLGDVPAHWSITKLKHATCLVVDCPHETPIYDPDGEFAVIRTADVSAGVLNLANSYRLNEDEYIKRTRRSEVNHEDIVYGREGERWGFAALVPSHPRTCLGQRMMQFRAAAHTSPAFLMWHLNADAVYSQGEVDVVGATSPHVNVETIRNFALVEPPVSEQKMIAEFVGREVAEIDVLIAKAQQAIELQKEHRTALISAAVTGKIDVRGMVDQESYEEKAA